MKVDTVVLGKLQAACISKITVELTIFLSCILMNETEYIMESVADVLWLVTLNTVAL